MRGHVRLCFTLCFAALAALARAEAPQGEYTVSGADSGALSFPVGGPEECATVRGVEICTTVASTVKSNVVGRIGDTNTAESPPPPGSIVFDGPSLSGTLEIRALGGILSGTTRKPKAVLELFADGNITDGAAAVKAVARGRVRCKVDPATPASLVCRGRAALSTSSINNQPIAVVLIPLALRFDLVAEPFDLELSLATDDEGAITGTADVAFASDATLPRHVVGRYDAARDVATLELIGFDTALGSKLTLKDAHFAGGAATGGKLDFKIAGEKSAP